MSASALAAGGVGDKREGKKSESIVSLPSINKIQQKTPLSRGFTRRRQETMGKSRKKKEKRFLPPSPLQGFYEKPVVKDRTEKRGKKGEKRRERAGRYVRI